MKQASKFDVICDNCLQVFHETVPVGTNGFNPEEPVNGSMLRLKEPYRSRGWSSFAENEDSEYGSLTCPGCGAVYGNCSGILKYVEQKETADALL